MGSSERERIQINGQPVVEIDFSAMQIGLLYARKGIDYWGTYDRDPYTLEGHEGEGCYRQLCKDCMTYMVACESKDKAIATTSYYLPRSYPEASKELPKQLINQLEAMHADIADCFYQGLGGSTQYQDSEIAMSILRHFTEKGIPVLGIHDSFIIERTYRNELEEKMMDSYSGVTNGATGRVA